VLELEQKDFKVLPQDELKEDVGSPTPLTIPGAVVVTTPELAKLIKSDSNLLLIDALGDPHELSLPNATRIPFAGNFGSLHDDDDTQRKLAIRLGNLTADNLDKRIVFFCQGEECWESYNAGLRAKNAGYRDIVWYRGGLSAWRAWVAAGSSDSRLAMQSISQTAMGLAQRLSNSHESFAAKWSDAVSLSEAVPVLLALRPPDIKGARNAYQAASDAFEALTRAKPYDFDLSSDSYNNQKNLPEIERVEKAQAGQQ
jgi:PQQ-dependent catabolism-associated CXXCW motif protein